MENETFSDTIDRILCNYEYEGIMGFGNSKILFDEIYVSVINNFSEHGNFLNVIPIHDREKIIATDLLTWMINYAENDVNMELNRLVPHRKKAYREINKNIEIIKEFENMILDNFSYLDVTINLNNEFDLQNKTEDIRNLEAIKKLLATTEKLKNDLLNKEYKIFPKNKYLPLDRIPKTKLEDILNKLIIDYKIKGHSIHKKALIDNLITL